MKRYILAIAAMMMITISASAMSINQARNEAQYLTDKMAVELALTDYEYEQAYRINLDYMLSIDRPADLYANPWALRNQALRALLTPMQWNRYIHATYFYRPVAWSGKAFVHHIYEKYPRHLAQAAPVNHRKAQPQPFHRAQPKHNAPARHRR